MLLEDIKKLANLARVDMDEEEMKEIGDSFDPILSYVGQIKEVSESADFHSENINDVPLNILREDVVTNECGKYADKIRAEMPETQDGYLKVKQIL